MPRSKQQNEQMRAESRQKILSTARQLFAARGYDGCAVSDIAQQAGMSQGSIYWYFKSKEDLLKAVLAEAFADLGVMLAEVAAYEGSGIEKLDYLIERYIAFGNEQGGVDIQIIVSSLTAHEGLGRLAELEVNTAEIGQNVQQAVAAIIAEAQAEGGIRPGIDPNLSAIFLLSFFNGLAFLYREASTTLPRQPIQDAALRLVGGSAKLSTK